MPHYEVAIGDILERTGAQYSRVEEPVVLAIPKTLGLPEERMGACVTRVISRFGGEKQRSMCTCRIFGALFQGEKKGGVGGKREKRRGKRSILGETRIEKM